MVHVKWHGHSCFEFSEGATVLVDPHDGASLGFPVPDARPDIVLISHGHDDHANGKHLFEGSSVLVLDEPCELEHKGVKIRGVKTYHDAVEGSRLGPNVVFVFEIDGVSFAHLGDLGHALDRSHLEEMGRVDVLITGIGRGSQLSEENIMKVDPRVVIPMHYHVEGIIFPYFKMMKVTEFTKGRSHVRWLEGSESDYEFGSLPEERETHVFRLW